MNDPNGMVYYKGEYHLFYQFHPYSDVWGPMHWGHAVSADMLQWEHLPIALFPDENGTIFSGSAVIDWENTSGFGAEAMVAIFTQDNDGRQAQSIAWSNDRGRLWQKYAGNPVIPSPGKGVDIRDPKVIRHRGAWLMLLAAKDRILFYSSKDLKVWQLSGSFGEGWGCTEGVWETPDLFELPIENETSTKWVLTVGVGDGFSGGSGTQYFLGTFDGKTFVCDGERSEIRWMDHGADYYAPQSFSDSPNDRRVMIAWMSNWKYAKSTPTNGWRGAMSLPRYLGLKRSSGIVYLVQQPILEMAALPQFSLLQIESEILRPNDLRLADLLLQQGKVTLRAKLDAAGETFAIHFGVGKDQRFSVCIDPRSATIEIDRTQSGLVDFHPFFSALHRAHFDRKDGSFELEIFIDRCSVEVFCQSGEVCITDLFFPIQGANSLMMELPPNGIDISHLEIISYK